MNTETGSFFFFFNKTINFVNKSLNLCSKFTIFAQKSFNYFRFCFSFSFEAFFYEYLLCKVLNKKKNCFCIYFVTDDVLFSRRGRMGRIVSPRHTLPPNTTCTYHFHGYPGDLIWLSFTSYNLQILQQAIHDNNTLGRVSFFFLFSTNIYKYKLTHKQLLL